VAIVGKLPGISFNLKLSVPKKGCVSRS